MLTKMAVERQLVTSLLIVNSWWLIVVQRLNDKLSMIINDKLSTTRLQPQPLKNTLHWDVITGS